MCFSLEASFIASFALFMISLLTISKVRSSSHIMIALIPLLFALQQACEGMLWLLLPYYNTLWVSIFKYGFLTFAFLIWPIWIPTSLLLVERSYYRKIALGICALLGTLWSLYMLSVLIRHGAYVALGCYHIYYSIDIPLLTAHSGLILYNLATVLPMFFSSVPNMQIFGILVFLACIASIFIWTQFFISVWCFFAAVISLLVYSTMKYLPTN